jgi:signal peptidase II
MLWYLIKKKPKNKLLTVSLVLIIGGGIGNMIDRVLLGYVIDFIDFCAFPNLWVWVFNIADAAICIGTGLLALYMIISTIEEAKAAKAGEAGNVSQENKENENDKSDSKPL